MRLLSPWMLLASASVLSISSACAQDVVLDTITVTSTKTEERAIDALCGARHRRPPRDRSVPGTSRLPTWCATCPASRRKRTTTIPRNRSTSAACRISGASTFSSTAPGRIFKPRDTAPTGASSSIPNSSAASTSRAARSRRSTARAPSAALSCFAPQGSTTCWRGRAIRRQPEDRRRHQRPRLLRQHDGRRAHRQQQRRRVRPVRLSGHRQLPATGPA